MSKTTKITAELEIKALLSDAQADLEAFSRGLQNAWKNGEPPKNLLKLYEQLGQRLTSMQETSKKGIVDSSELSQVTADYKAFQKILHELGVNFKLLSTEQKRALLSKEEQDAMKARAEAVSKYNEVLKKNQEILSKRQAPEGQIKKAKGARATAEETKKDITGQIAEKNKSVPKKTAEIEAYKAAQESLKVVLEKIKKTEEAIANERARGTPEGEGRNNSLTRSLKNLEVLKQQAADLEATSGKEAYEKYTADMKEHEEALASLQQQYADAENTIKEANETIAQAEKKLSGLNVANESEAFKTLKSTLQKLGVEGIESADSLEDLTSAIKDCDKKAYSLAEKSLQGVIDQSDKLQKSMEDVGDELDKTNASMERQKQAVADNNAFEEKIKQFLGLSGAAQLLRSALRDAIATITELDATMTEMAVVTDLTVGDYWDQLPEYSKQASNLRVSINSAYKAATLYYQQGLKGNEVTKISAETLKLAKNAGIDAADATNKMTAALRGFNMELNEASAQRVADVYSELAAITAADVDEISNAMTKTASIAHSAGMEFETTAAFLSQIVETTRESAETAGTALKTVIARFQELKKDPSEIGEVDGEIVDANKIETALRSVGVALRDSSGQFRDLDDVFMDLSKKWDGLDKNTQRYIATIAAGSRQQSRFIAMMSDYGRTQELVTAANNSAGASNRQFEKTMESLEAKVEKLKNAWHEFTMGILQSDLVKFGVDVLTKLLEVINKATSAFGGFGSSISKIGAILTTFKIGKSLFEKIPQSFKQAMVDVVREAIEGGKKAGEGAVEAAREGAENAKKGKKGEKPEEGAAGTKKTFGEALTELKTTPKKDLAKQVGKSALNVTGVGDIIGGFKTGAEQREKQRQLNIWDKNGGRETLETVQQGTAKALETTTQDRDAAKTKFDTASATLAQLEQEEEKLNSQKPTKKKDKKKLNKDKKELAEKKEKATKDKNDAEEEYKKTEEAQKAAAKANEQATEDLQAYDDLQKDVAENGGAGWKQVADGFGKLGAAATGAGLAVTAVGQAFIDAGAEEFGGALQKVGSVLTFIGTASSLVSTAMSILSAIFPVAGAAGATSGTATSVAWSPVTIIALAIVAALALLLIGFLAVSAIMKSFSPEEKLKKAQAAADAAAEAADEAAAAYDRLSEALDSLEGKYKALEELTRGTKEWNEAVQAINDSVLDLVADYPELAAFVENKNGVLTIDVNSQGVQEVLNQAEARKVMAKNESIMANVAVAKAEDDVAYSKLDNDAKVDYRNEGVATGIALGTEITALGAAIGTAILPGIGTAIGAGIGLIGGTIAGVFAGSAVEAQNQAAAKEDTDKIAKAIASGEAGTTKEDLQKYLEETMKMAPDAAAEYADQMWDNVDEMRDYGRALNETEQQQKAAFDAMAMQAQQLANTLSMTDEQIQQSTNIVDGDLTEKLYNSKMEELTNLQDEADSGDDQYNGYREDIEKAIKQKYGSSAKLGDDGEITYVGEDGDTKTVTLDDEEMKNMIATQYATEGAKNAIENSAASTQTIIGEVGKQIGNSGAAEKAINAMYMEGNGGALTQADLKLLSESNIDYQAIWDAMSPEEQQVYGNDMNAMINDFNEAVSGATSAFEDTKDVVRDFMTADMAQGFKSKLDEIAKGAGGEEAKQKIQQATDTLMAKEGLDTEDKQAIQSRINMTDWTNQEELLSLQLDLQYEYGYTAEEAQAYTATLGEAAYATSKLATTVRAFGDLWKATEKINQSMTRLTQLQWEYDQALESGAGNIGTLIDDMLAEYQLQATEYQNAYEASNDDLAKIYAQGKTNYGIDLTKMVTLGENGIDVDSMALQEAIDSKKISQEDADKWIDSLKGQYETSQEQIEGLQNTLDSIEELEQQGKDAYYELRNMAKEAVLGQMQKQIDLQQDTLDATRDANAQLIGKIQEQIDDNRQARANQEAKENIANLQAQQAYLGMDTSGANALQMQGLDEQIADAEQNYQDSLVDQALQNLQDANAKAEEQRQQQIDLAQSQLDAYSLSAAFQQDIDTALHDMLAGGTDWSSSNLGQLITEQFTKGMSEEEKADWSREVSSQVGQANGWLTTDWNAQKEAVNKKLTEIKTGLDSLPEEITNSANKKVYDEQSTEMERLGFDMESAGIVDSSGGYTASAGKGLANMKNMAEQDAGYANSTAYKQIQSHQKAGYKGEVMSQSEYYAANSKGIADGTAKSYTQYLNDELDKASRAHTLLYDELGGMSVPVTKTYITDTSEGSNFDMKINGTTYDWVEFQTKVTNAQHVKKLNEIYNKTGKNDMVYMKNAFGNAYAAKPGPAPHDDDVFLRYGGNWYTLRDQVSDTKDGNYIKTALDYVNANKNRYYHYKSGGLADFTGPAWLDGTKSRPEYILNADQTERFFSLVDVLEGFDNKDGAGKAGDNYFDIKINVDKLENDYDVEQMANKIRSMIYEDASYRNVNSINLIR